MPKAANDFDVKPLLRAGWEFMPYGGTYGYWVDPITGSAYQTADALRVLVGLPPVGFFRKKGQCARTEWTRDGIYCHASGQDCENCVVFTHYGIKRGKGCFQWQTVEILLGRGILPPAQNRKESK